MCGAATARTVSVCWADLLDKNAVRVTSRGAAGLPAQARNFVFSEPEPIVTLAGTLKTARLLDKVTVTGLLAASVSITVQVALCPVPRVAGVQLKPDNCAGATRFNVNVCVTPLALAVTTAV
jgi:hypothetical protein